MPEGPEVRRHAENVRRSIEGGRIALFEARTRAARAWLEARPGLLIGRQVARVRSHGKHLIGWIDGGFYFHSHLMMWGRWETLALPPPERDRRERARIVTDQGSAILFSAPIFEVGEGDPYHEVPALATLGPDIIPYPGDGPFDAEAFRRRLLDWPAREIGAVLLDQRVAAGIGNYLRAEVLFLCRLNPWKTVGALTPEEVACLEQTIAQTAVRAYMHHGQVILDADRERMSRDPSLVYAPGRDWAMKHHVFRRTNLPCLACGTPIRQQRQTTREADGDTEEKTRIIYFCPSCQHVPVEAPRRSPRSREGVL